jgi:hypothetical protein
VKGNLLDIFGSICFKCKCNASRIDVKISLINSASLSSIAVYLKWRKLFQEALVFHSFIFRLQTCVMISCMPCSQVHNKLIYLLRMSSGMLCRVDLVRTDVSEESSSSIIRVRRIRELRRTLARSVLRLLVTTNVVPSSQILSP